MQKGKTILLKEQQDPTLTPSTSMVRIIPKEIVDQHDYHIMTYSKVQGAYDHDR